MEQARRANVAKADEVTIEIPETAATEDSRTAEFPFMRGTRESSYVSLYRASWNLVAPQGTQVTVVLRSEKGGVDRRTLTLND
jgi:hypothetical protein